MNKSTFLKKPSSIVFLCYSHMDYDSIITLYTRLKKDGVQVWLDKEELLPGQNWEDEIRKAIFRSNIIIVCFSQQFNRQGGYRHKELKLALEKASLIPNDEIFIIPARLEKCDIPKSLCHLQRVDLFEVGGYKKLIRSLRKYASAK